MSDQPHPTGDQPAQTYTIDELAEKLRQARVASMAQFGQSSSAFEDSRPLSVRDPAGYEEIAQMLARIPQEMMERLRADYEQALKGGGVTGLPPDPARAEAIAQKVAEILTGEPGGAQASRQDLEDTKAIGELVAAGETSPAKRDHAADHATTVTIHEAAQRTGISVTTWRRRLRTAQVPGAYRAPGPKGEEWRIPVTALDTVTVLTPAAVVTPDAQAVADLQHRVTELERLVEVQRALADERKQALDQLHATMRALGAGLATPAATEAPRRKRWGRKRTP